MSSEIPIQTFYIKAFHTDSGVILPSLKLAYCTYGRKAKGSKVIGVSTCFGEKLNGSYNLIGAGKPLDPAKYFIVQVGLIGGSDSSSPSNTPAPHSFANFPHTTYSDNARAQRVLFEEHFGVEKLEAYVGFSMGGQMAYHVGAIWGAYVDKIVCLGTSAKTSWHNYCFLEGPKTALINSGDYSKGGKGARGFGRAYAAWLWSHEWFRQEKWRDDGFDTLDEYLIGASEEGNADWDGYDLLCLSYTWQHGNIAIATAVPGAAAPFANITEALKGMKPKALVMPSRTDQYFPPEDSMFEVKHLPKAKLAIVESIYGHPAAGGGGTEEDEQFLEKEIGAFLNE